MKTHTKHLLIGLLFLYSLSVYFLSPKLSPEKPTRYIILYDSKDLNIEDMMGAEEIWSRSAARIFTGITLIKEDEKYIAKAVLDRHQSWIASEFKSSKEIFNHENYHVKLAKAIAKEFNEEISRSNFYPHELNEKLSYYNRKHKRLQIKYDKESNHSRNKIQQAYWEYKIDSLYNLGKHYHISEEASVFFPTPPRVQVWQFLEDTLYGNGSFVNKLEFVVLELKPTHSDSTYLIDYFTNKIFRENSKYNLIDFNPTAPNSILFGYSKDTVNKIETHSNILVDSQFNFYLARYAFPYFEDQDSTLIKVGVRFFDSIKFKSDPTPSKTP